MSRKVRELTDDRENENYQNGRISLREFVMAIMQADIDRIDGISAANAKRIDDRITAEMKRLEAVMESQIDKLDINTDAIKETMMTQNEINKERLDTHNKFREQIERERQDLVRKDDLARVEESMAMRFTSIQEKTDAALDTTQKALKEADSRLADSFRTRDTAIETIRGKQDSLDGKWTAQTVAIAVVTIGFTAMSIVLYVLAGR